jgi:hypothetical protein
MRFVIAQRRLATPGGSETFVLTIAEHIGKLGHEVTIWALDLGLAAKIAQQRVINVVSDEAELPEEADATIALDQIMAIDLARRYPSAARLFAMHATTESWFPPPERGIVAATLAANDRFALLAGGCVGAGEVVRIRQPIDLVRFGPRGSAQERPSRILVISNYLRYSTQRIAQLQKAWSHPGLEWRFIGKPQPSVHVADEMAAADIVVGYGRSILEAMACSRPAYVHDHSGSDGWVTTESYARLEADGFAGTGVRSTPGLEELREDFQRYDPELGRIGHDFIRTHHDARMVAAEIVALANRLGPPSRRHDPAAIRALRNLAEWQHAAYKQLQADRKQLAKLREQLRATRKELRVTRKEFDKELRVRHMQFDKELRVTRKEFDKELRVHAAKLDAVKRPRRSAKMRMVFCFLDWLQSLIRR